VIERVRGQATNLAGLKVSESPFAKVEPYLDLDLPVLVGSEPLIPAAIARGATGSVSGLAAAFPEEVRAGLDQPDEAAEARLVKHVLGRRGVPVRGDMRAPMRVLDPAEVQRLDAALDALVTSPA
jgi:dihydrodipicolinate synthase/N-acetylneuraminate lyase